MKYIVMTYQGLEYLFTCPNNPNLTHEHFAEVVRAMKFDEGDMMWRRMRSEGDVVSAGFVNSQGWCHGRSESLNLDSREEDSALLASQYT